MGEKQILFIGDSITDCGRENDHEGLGSGYVRIVHDYLVTSYPNQAFHVINKGISGNRITDLASRWQEDVIALKPDYLSISIGINDVWRQLDRPEIPQVNVEQFEKIYHDLLKQVKEKTNAKIMLMEPTVIKEDVNARGNKMLKDYVNVVQKVAEQFDATVVPTHQAFTQYLQAHNGYKLTTDGVHMNTAGNMLMATTWIRTVEEQLK